LVLSEKPLVGVVESSARLAQKTILAWCVAGLSGTCGFRSRDEESAVLLA
jgi:hypothetical protein